jgi:hypothetical protein
MQSTIPYRTLGRTGERVSAIGLGGWHLGLERVDEQLGVRIMRTAIDRGINFLDNCWDYNGGASETRMGKALRDGYARRSLGEGGLHRLGILEPVPAKAHIQLRPRQPQPPRRLRLVPIGLAQRVLDRLAFHATQVVR